MYNRSKGFCIQKVMNRKLEGIAFDKLSQRVCGSICFYVRFRFMLLQASTTHQSGAP